MADQLAKKMPPNKIMPGVDRAEYLKMHNELDEIESVVESALADRREKLAQIKARLGDKNDFAMFKVVRKDMELSGESREQRVQSYKKQMEWIGRPVNFQATMDLASDTPPVVVQMNIAELRRIDREGEAAGKAGHDRAGNSYTPGTEQAARWDQAWLRGQSTIAASMAPPSTSAADGPQLRKRGRPPGSRNRPKVDPEASDEDQALAANLREAANEFKSGKSNPPDDDVNAGAEIAEAAVPVAAAADQDDAPRYH